MPVRLEPKPAERKTLIAKAKDVHRRCGQRWVPVDEFCKLAGISRYRLTRCFDSYGELLREAGLPPRGPNGRIPDDELMRAMAETFREQKGPIPFLRFRRLARYSPATYLQRWETWRATLCAFGEWQRQHDPEFPYADQLPGGKDAKPETPVWPARGGRRYGETLNFRGLLHAPVNEQGVVFLFATLAVDLGYLVDSLTSEFPDCEAKRCVGSAWEKVRIEFEYESRNFRVHAHDPEGCDLIVCWEHNWEECPLEVLELKSVVMQRQRLPSPPFGGEGASDSELVRWTPTDKTPHPPNAIASGPSLSPADAAERGLASVAGRVQTRDKQRDPKVSREAAP